MWLDESHTLYTALLNTKDLIFWTSLDTNPPFYFFVIKYWTKCFGFSIESVRSFSVFCNFCTLLVLGFLCKRHFNYKTWIFSAMLFITSNAFIYYSNEARSFTLVALLAAISTFIFFEILYVDKKRIALVFLLAIVNALLIYTHFVSAFVIVSQLVIGLIYALKDLKKMYLILISNIITCVLFFPWLKTLFLRLNVHKTKAFWLEKPKYIDVVDLLKNFAATHDLLYYYFPAIIVISLLLIKFKKYKISIDFTFITKNIYLILISFGTIAGAFFASNIHPMFLERYVLYSLLGFIVFIAYLFSNIQFKYSNVFFVIVLAFIGIHRYNHLQCEKPNFEPNQSIVDKVKSIAPQNANIYISPNYFNSVFMYYYDKSRFKPTWILAEEKREFINPDTPEALESLLQNNKKLIIVKYGDFDTNQKVIDYAISKYPTKHIYTIRRATIYEF